MTPDKYAELKDTFGDEVADMIQDADRRREWKERQRKKPKVKETDIQADILTWLKLNNFFCWRNNTQGAIQQIGGGNAVLKQSYARGAADIIGCLPNGRMFCIEVKTPTYREPSSATLEAAHRRWVKEGKKDPYETYRAQKLFERKVKDNNAIYILARGLDDVTRILQCYLVKAEKPLPAC